MNSLSYIFNKKTIKNWVRKFAIILAVFIVVMQIYRLFFLPVSDSKIQCFIYIFLNSISVALSVKVAIQPQKIWPVTVVGFGYALSIFIFDSDIESFLGIFMFGLGVSRLYASGFFMTYGKRKSAVLIVSLMILFISRLRFGLINFSGFLLKSLVYMMVCLVSLFFYAVGKTHTFTKEKKILNIAEYPELNNSDVLLLQKVLEDKPYKVIAIELGLSEGGVRNRLCRIYHVLTVKDRTGFLFRYNGFKVVYDNSMQAF